MNSVGNLMNHPDAFGQYYHPTPTPAAMGNIGNGNTYQYSKTIKNDPIIVTGKPDLNNYDQGPWQHSKFYYETEEDDPNMNQHIDYYYYDSGGYSDRQGDFYNTDENLTPTTEYIHTNYYDYDQDMEQKIRDIRKNDAIFRQGDSFDWLAGFVNTAVQIISLVSSIVSPEPSTPQNTIDRNDVAGNLNSDGDDLDVAMGTLMAYGGKYLREMALWAWEYGTQTPLESLGTVPSATQTLSQVASVSVAKPVSTEPYLSTLNQAELEALGLKAVSAGANPQKLQQAFATAQIKGDWTKLEKEIAAVLGLQAINHPEIGLAIQTNNAIANKVDNIAGSTSTSTSSVVSNGPGLGSGIISTANNYITRLQKVVNPPPIALNPDGTPVDPDEAIRNQNIVTRFVTEFGLEQEMLSAQSTLNGVIVTVNNFLEPGGVNEIDRIGVAGSGSGSSGTSSTSTSSQGSLLTTISQTVGSLAAAAIKFITPSPTSSQPGQLPKNPWNPAQSYSEIRPFLDLNQVTFGILGVAALGTVGYGLYASNARKKSRRRIYQRSVNDYYENENQDQLWMQIGKAILKGLLEEDLLDESCLTQYEKCLQLKKSKFRYNSSEETGKTWKKKCFETRLQCRRRKSP